VRRWLLVPLVLSLALACGRSNVHRVHGVVREVDAENKQAVIEHEDIPGLMSAMTMSFDVPDPAVLAKLVPGQKVLFELEATNASFRVVGVLEEGATARAGAARSPSVSSVARSGDVAPDFSLVDQNGAKLAKGDLRGRWALVDFVYTRCNGPCPILTSLHVELQKKLAPELRERVHFVSISLDPEFDTPPVLARYAQERGADLSTWSFLTGPPEQVADVVKRFGVGTLRAADGTIDHVVATFLIDPDGRIVKRWLGLENGVEERRAEIAADVAASPPAPGAGTGAAAGS
jgi:protein SCO1/2